MSDVPAGGADVVPPPTASEKAEAAGSRETGPPPHRRWTTRTLSLAWELPQTTLGAAVLVLEAARNRVVSITREEDRFVIETTGTAVSLGHVVFWSQRSSRWHTLDARNRAHELGHARQSRLLGPLYLPIVGIPSTARAAFAFAFREVTGRKWDGYYRGFPERWADELGGVTR